MKYSKSKRRYDHSFYDEDPLSGMANLFDVSMVFALALMLALVTKIQMQEFFSEDDFTVVKNPGKNTMEIIRKHEGKIERYKADKNDKNKNENGKKVGTAYQLETGEIVYIPE